MTPIREKKKFNIVKQLFSAANSILQQRAIPVGGNHSDLAARALVAFEQNIPVTQSEDFARDLRHEYSHPALLINSSTNSTATEVLSQRYHKLH